MPAHSAPIDLHLSPTYIYRRMAGFEHDEEGGGNVPKRGAVRQNDEEGAGNDPDSVVDIGREYHGRFDRQQTDRRRRRHRSHPRIRCRPSKCLDTNDTYGRGTSSSDAYPSRQHTTRHPTHKSANHPRHLQPCTHPPNIEHTFFHPRQPRTLLPLVFVSLCPSNCASLECNLQIRGNCRGWRC